MIHFRNRNEDPTWTLEAGLLAQRGAQVVVAANSPWAGIWDACSTAWLGEVHQHVKLQVLDQYHHIVFKEVLGVILPKR